MEALFAAAFFVSVGCLLASHLVRDPITGLGRKALALDGLASAGFAVSMVAFGLRSGVGVLALVYVPFGVCCWVASRRMRRGLEERAEPKDALEQGERVHGTVASWTVEPPFVARIAHLSRDATVAVTAPELGRGPVDLRRALHPKVVWWLERVGEGAPIELRRLGDEVAIDWRSTLDTWRSTTAPV